MLKVALTGGIATGKSHVLSKLREWGIPTIDADDLVHHAFAPSTPTAAAVAAAFGSDMLTPEGGVDRAALGARVFADAEARVRLESLVHPVVYAEIRKWFETLQDPMGVASIPLLFETGHASDFDAVIVTVCTAEQQLQRTIKRGLSEDEARRRIAAQMPSDEKVRRADYVIHTNGTLAETDEQVAEVVRRLTTVIGRQS